jgi:hypothetical protein
MQVLSERIISKVRNLMNENKEPLIFYIHCETAHHGDFYIELRKTKDDSRGILYQFYEGTARTEGSFSKCSFAYMLAIRNHGKHFSGIDEAMEDFNYRPFIRSSQLDDADYRDIVSLLKKNPLPNIEATHGGLDGCRIVFQNYVNCTSKYSYWVYPPKGYKHLKVITNITSKYIDESYADYIYLGVTR